MSMRAACSFLIAGLALPVAAAEVPFSDPRWQIAGERAGVVEMNGREALHLHNGRAALPDAAFVNGVVEFDVMVTPERVFTASISACRTATTARTSTSARTRAAMRTPISTRRYSTAFPEP
jgi:hypothetical protein